MNVKITLTILCVFITAFIIRMIFLCHWLFRKKVLIERGRATSWSETFARICLILWLFDAKYLQINKNDFHYSIYHNHTLTRMVCSLICRNNSDCH